MLKFKLDFNQLSWQLPIQGVKCKADDDGHKRIRCVEYSRNIFPHWCEKGHCGLILEGEIEFEFTNEKIVYKKGDGMLIPDGPQYKHKVKPLTSLVKAVFIEDV